MTTWSIVVPLLVVAAAGSAGGQDLEAARRAEQRLAGTETSILHELEEIDRRSGELKVRIDRARVEAQAARVAVGEATARLESRRESLAGGRAALRRRVRALYRLTPARAGRAVLKARSRGEMLGIREGLARVVRWDREAIARYAEVVEKLEADRSALRGRQAALEHIETRLAAETRALEAEREERRAMLATVREKRGLTGRLIGEIEAASRALATAVEQLPQHGTSGGFAARRQRLAVPADGAVSVPFGRVKDPTFGARVAHMGWDIAAPAGAPVRAVHAGSVVFAGWFKGYGRLVILDHGDRFHTLMAHLSEVLVEQGQRVEAEQVVARVGDTGSVKGAFLYFEIRHQGKPVDPAEWLRR
jgi:septal ring factor EnvC (AmiA/AmiB activator)